MTGRSPTGILVMAYGTAGGPDDVERYYTDIRGGRPPSPEHLADLKARYAAIGNRFPLLDITRRQAAGLERALNDRGEGPVRAFLGMKHSPPFIADGVAEMREAGIERAVGIVMAPHWSGMSVETYVDRVTKAVDEGESEGEGPAFTFIPQWYEHPAFIDFLSSRVANALDRLDPERRAEALVIFSAHSLPQRAWGDGESRCLRCDHCPDRCRYRAQLEETAHVVADALGLPAHGIGWQSAGRTADPWLGPPVEEVILAAAKAGHTAVVVCPAGFVADHLEILYDLDVEAKAAADEAGVAFVRTEMPNDDPAFLDALASVVADHLRAAVPG